MRAVADESLSSIPQYFQKRNGFDNFDSAIIAIQGIKVRVIGNR